MGGAHRGRAADAERRGAISADHVGRGRRDFLQWAQTEPYALIPGSSPGLTGFYGSAGDNARLARFQQLLTFDSGVSLVQDSSAVMTQTLAQSRFGRGAEGPAALQTISRRRDSGRSCSKWRRSFRRGRRWACSGRFSSARWAVRYAHDQLATQQAFTRSSIRRCPRSTTRRWNWECRSR